MKKNNNARYKKKILVIHNSNKKININFLKNNNKYFIINLNASLNFSNLYNENLNKNIEQIFIKDRLNKIYNENYNFFYKIFKNYIKTNSEIVKTRFFDLNFTDIIWKKYSIIVLIKKLQKELSINKIIFLEYDYHLINNLNFNSILIKSIHKNYLLILLNLFKKYIFYFSLFLFNFINEFLLSFVIMFRKKNKINILKRIIFCTFPNNWKNVNNNFVYRYTGNHFLNLDSDTKYFVSLLRCNQEKNHSFFKSINSIISINKNNSILIAESFSNPLDVINSYFFNSITKNKVFFKNNFLNKLNLGSFYNDLKLRYYLIEKPKNLMINKQIYNLLSSSKNLKSAIIPLHQLYEQRVLIKNLKKHKIPNVVGIQQGSIGLCHIWRFIFSQSLLCLFNNEYFPTVILIEGLVVKKYFDKYGIKNYYIVGPQRINELPPKFTLGKKSNKILILLDMHNWKNLFNDLFYFIEKNKNVKFIIKPHPSRLNQVSKYLNKYFSLFKNLSLSYEISLNDTLIKNPNCIILANETGAVVELSRVGWPCFLISHQSYPSINPLALVNTKLYYSLDSLEDSLEKILSLNYSHLKEYTNLLKSISKKHFDTYGNVSTKKMINLLKKYEK